MEHRMRQVRPRQFVLGSGVVLLFLVGIILSNVVDVSVSWRTQALAGPGEYYPSYRHTNGLQVALLYIGSSTCSASNNEKLPSVFQSLIRQTSDFAMEIGASFTTVGSTNDWRTDRAFDHLRRIARFDELALGGNWANHAIMAATWRNGFVPAVPAIAVIVRQFETPSESGQYLIRDEDVVFYISGLDRIIHQELIGLDNVLRQRMSQGAKIARE
jgi:hypothetical protein